MKAQIMRKCSTCKTNDKVAFDAVDGSAPGTYKCSNCGANRVYKPRKGKINQEDLRDTIREVLRTEFKSDETNRPVIKISFPHKKDRVVVQVDNAHQAFADVMQRVAAELPVLLVGPAGSGKTTLAAQVATALGRRFTFNSLSEGVTESSLMGRMLPQEDGTWAYQESPFVKTFRDGGVHLFDEIDAADPNLLVSINAAIANGKLSLPFTDMEPIERHPKCVIIAAANTYGQGADRRYVGRNRLDAATVNRFTMGTCEIGYDKDLERRLAYGYLADRGADAELLLNWAWSVRDSLTANRMDRILSTRNIVDCAKLLLIGKTMVECSRIFTAGWTEDEKSRVRFAF